MTPLARACRALRLPKGLYLDRGDLLMKDAEIRAALRQQHVSAERLTLALADLLGYDLSNGALWPIVAGIAKRHDLPASMTGFLVALAMLPEEGDADPDEWGFMVEAAP